MDIQALQSFIASYPKTVVLGAAVILGLAYVTSSSKKSVPRDPNLPPRLTSMSFKEYAEMAFISPYGPPLLLALVRDFGEADFEIPQIPFAPPFYLLTDYRSARKALEDVSSTKWDRTNLFFKRTTHEGLNVIIAEGHRWKHVRKSTSSAFSASNVKLMVEQIDVIVDAWIEDSLKPFVEAKKPILILEEMNKITANVIAKIAFDYDIDDEERSQFLIDLSICWTEFGVKPNGNLLMQIPFTAWMFPGIRKGRKASKRMFEFCRKMLDSYRAKDDKDKKPHKLIHMILEDGEYEDDGERIRDMIGYVIAGFDTTANTLSFALRELAMNPGEQEKLRTALRQAADPESARNCPELRMVTKETLRMYPAAALGSIRQLGNDLVLPTTKKIIPKGSIINTPYYVIQRDENLYENPDTFKPSRWEDPTREQSMSLLTFSLGRRSCQGQALANAEMYEILYKLIRNFHFDIVEKGEPHSVLLFKPVGTVLSARIVN